MSFKEEWGKLTNKRDGDNGFTNFKFTMDLHSVWFNPPLARKASQGNTAQGCVCHHTLESNRNVYVEFDVDNVEFNLGSRLNKSGLQQNILQLPLTFKFTL